ncbi:MAG: hypothetical protein KAT00_06790 [Planctomycetes bacterium]|nr:hypothetical protein [Planctomycetota bacterium]
MHKRRTAYILVLIGSSIFAQAWAEGFEMPSVLPNYYSVAFEKYRKELVPVNQSTENGVEQCIYSTRDESWGLSVENIKCDRPRGTAIFNNILGYWNNEIKAKKGQFLEITQTEIHAKIHEDGVEKMLLAYMLPASIQIWTYATEPERSREIEADFRIVRSLVDRQRCNEALSEGNISMGLWGSKIFEHARQLFREGNQKDGMFILEQLLATSPSKYDAHISFMEMSTDSAAAMTSAKIVFKNAEDSKLIDKAAKYLGTKLKTLDSIPMLDKGETGLQVILVPLEPCNLWLLADVAQTYQQITGVPVKIRRLQEKWTLGSPDRIPYQRAMQSHLVRLKEEDIDFTGWKKDRYIEELLKAIESEDALSRYYVRNVIDKIDDEPGQYLVDPYLDWFSQALQKYRSDDDRTMYVGMTEVNIYSGDNNFIFSTHTARKESQASILSYSMMLAKALSEEYESRQRLTERIAKELVPASLKSLGIPRSTDPTCPYSYSSGISRLDQKTLRLSDSVTAALEKLK